MRMFSLPDRREPAPIIVGPLTPSSYLTLRRHASGYTQEKFARALVTLAEHRDPFPRPRLTIDKGRARYRKARDFVRLLERRGSVCRCHIALRDIASLFPFDPDLYRQLDVQPAAQHPPICRSCGCSGHDACIDDHDNVCRWVIPNLCSHCVDGGISCAEVAA